MMADILIVDDDLDSGDGLARLLRRDSYDVECVSDGVTALTRILAKMPTLVVLDLLMPIMDGAELLETLRSYFRLQALPVIVWTSHADSPLADHARNLKINSIVKKGKSSYDDILNEIRRALPTQSARGEDEDEEDAQPI